MRRNNLCLVALCLVWPRFSRANNVEQSLQTHLLTNYNYNVRPVSDVSKPIELKIGMAVLSINQMNQLDGEVAMDVWLRYTWKDEFLTWNETEYPLDFTTFPTFPEFESKIWVPDIMIYRSVALPMAELEYTKAMVYSDGTVSWSRPGTIKASHRFNLQDYPFDAQTINLELGSWAYDDSKMTLESNGVDTTAYTENLEWNLKDAEATIISKVYGCCPDPFSSISFAFTMKRFQKFYGMNLIMPALSICVMGLLGMEVPWDSGERASIMATAVLTLTIYIGLLIEYLPFTDDVPWMARFMTMLWWFSIIAFMVGVFSIKMRTFIMLENRVPLWLWRMSGLLARRLPWLGFHEILAPNEQTYCDIEEQFHLLRRSCMQAPSSPEETTALNMEGRKLCQRIDKFIDELFHKFSDDVNQWHVVPLPKSIRHGQSMLENMTLLSAEVTEFVEQNIVGSSGSTDIAIKKPQVPPELSLSPICEMLELGIPKAEDLEISDGDFDSCSEASNGQGSGSAIPDQKDLNPDLRELRRRQTPKKYFGSEDLRYLTYGFNASSWGIEVPAGSGDELGGSPAATPALSPSTPLSPAKKARLDRRGNGVFVVTDQRDTTAMRAVERDKYLFIHAGKMTDRLCLVVLLTTFGLGNIILWAYLI